MNMIDRAVDAFTGALAGASIGANNLRATADMAEESLISERGDSGMPEVGTQDKLTGHFSKAMEGAFAELELAVEDQGWRAGGASTTFNFTRQTLKRIVGLSRVMYLINPLIKRVVTVQELYVWGRGVKIKAENPEVQLVLDDFFNHRKNQRVIGDAWPERERDQRVDGNTFFVFFRNKLNGTARVRLLPFDQIEGIIYNPKDSKEPHFYVRTAQVGSPSGLLVQSENVTDVVEETTLYPDWDYTVNGVGRQVQSPDGAAIAWDTCVYHVKTGGLSIMRFGLPELFSAHNWAIGYKKVLENFATILSAYARLALLISGLPGKAGVAASKAKLKTGVQNGRTGDTNPAPNTASWALLSGSADVKPIKTAGSTTGPDEARALRSMVAAGGDTPEHFFGDSDIGNFATSSTLDRPTELKMVSRQTMWAGVINAFAERLIQWSAAAPNGVLNKAGYKAVTSRDPFDGTVIITVIPPAGKSINVNVEFPNILERDVTDRVRAVVMATTMGGSPAEGIFPNRDVVCRLLLEALGEEEAERMTELMYPSPVTQGFADPAEKLHDEGLIAQGRKELGDAALIAANAAKTTANKPTPKPSGSPLAGGKK